MESSNGDSRGRVKLAVDIDPETVDAGDEVLIGASLLCDPVRDLRGRKLPIMDASGSNIGTLEITEFDGEIAEGETDSLKAPLSPGDYRWDVGFPAYESEGVLFEAVSASVAFTVKAHTTQIVVWDIPPAVVAGEKFRLKIGVKCSADCDFAGKEFSVCDHAGKFVASAVLSGDVWRGTEALHYTELELPAPKDEGLYRWRVSVPLSDHAIAHSDGQAEFGLCVGRKPECNVRIAAISKETGEPLPGALITMHPYKTVADENGVASLNVTRGEYRLFVAKAGYLTNSRRAEISKDLSVEAALEIEVIEERN